MEMYKITIDPPLTQNEISSIDKFCFRRSCNPNTHKIRKIIHDVEEVSMSYWHISVDGSTIGISDIYFDDIQLFWFNEISRKFIKSLHKLSGNFTHQGWQVLNYASYSIVENQLTKTILDPIKKITVIMDEQRCHCLMMWNGEYTPIETFPVSDKLRVEIDDWRSNSMHSDMTPCSLYEYNGEEIDEFNFEQYVEDGLTIANKIKAALPDWVVEYKNEMSDEIMLIVLNH